MAIRAPDGANNYCRIFGTSNDVLNKRGCSQFNSNEFSKHLVFCFIGKTVPSKTAKTGLYE